MSKNEPTLNGERQLRAYTGGIYQVFEYLIAGDVDKATHFAGILTRQGLRECGYDPDRPTPALLGALVDDCAIYHLEQLGVDPRPHIRKREDDYDSHQ